MNLQILIENIQLFKNANEKMPQELPNSNALYIMKQIMQWNNRSLLL